MIASKKSHPNFSDYNQFLLKKDLNLIKNEFENYELKKSSANCIYDYVHSFVGEEFQSNAPCWFNILVGQFAVLLANFCETLFIYMPDDRNFNCFAHV